MHLMVLVGGWQEVIVKYNLPLVKSGVSVCGVCCAEEVRCYIFAAVRFGGDGRSARRLLWMHLTKRSYYNE